MNLWNRGIHEITYKDIEAYCALRIPEAGRLDYKLQVPADLTKLVAAFANTLGGLVLIGIDADKTTNTPIWPPVNGLPARHGLEEQVVAACRDAIYPPVRPHLKLIDNDGLPGHVIVVVRVDESPEAPHAVEKNRRVYIYERTGSQNRPYELADIGRIQYLLNRRQRIEKDREDAIQLGINRARGQLVRCIVPLRWASVIPYFPWRPLTEPEQCFRFNQAWSPASLYQGHWNYQRMPGGSLGLGYEAVQDQRRAFVAAKSVTADGHVFGITYAMENKLHNPQAFRGTEESGATYLHYSMTVDTVKNVLEGAKRFYEQPGTERPGYLMLSIGVLNALNVIMYGESRASLQRFDPSRFPDTEFRATAAIHAEEFLKDPVAAAQPLFQQLAFGFDHLLS